MHAAHCEKYEFRKQAIKLELQDSAFAIILIITAPEKRAVKILFIQSIIFFINVDSTVQKYSIISISIQHISDCRSSKLIDLHFKLMIELCAF